MIHGHSDRCTLTKKGKRCDCCYRFPRDAAVENTFDVFGRVNYKRPVGNTGPCLYFEGTNLKKYGKN